MARQPQVSIANNFTEGLITETTPLNFPENGCSDTFNCVFDKTGRVYRRKGFNHEINYSTKQINRNDGVITKFLWEAPAGRGDLTLLVMQVGSTLYFYNTNNVATVSEGAISSNINLTTYSPSGAPSPATVNCQFTSGRGYLFVTHPYLNSFYVSFDPTTNTVTGTAITLQIRDFEGVNDSLAVTARPTSLSNTHHYNILNQGWTTNTQVYTSTTSINYVYPSTAFDITFTIASGQTITTGEPMHAYMRFDLSRGFSGTVTSYSGTSLRIQGYGSRAPATQSNIADWIIAREAPHIQKWNSGLGTYPSNADYWWAYKDSTDAFNHSMVANVPVPTRPAPKGRFILNLYDQNRNTVSGLTGLPGLNTGGQRVSTCAFFAGRVFYSGISYPTLESKVFFSQIIENENEFGKCYQANDPTSEEFYDLLPTDGGVISIQDAGIIIKLFALKEGLLVFATNGIWYITGSTGIGFTANDYSVQKLSNIRCLSANSFVNVEGLPIWWNVEGIYTVGSQEGSASLQVIPVSEQKIKEFYKNIPLDSKKYASGAYDPTTGVIQWCYSSSSSSSINESQEYDSILCLNSKTGAFYPWKISDSTVKVHGVFIVVGAGGNPQILNVIVDNGDNVVTDSGDNVVIYSISPGATTYTFKYIISEPNGSTYDFTFAEESNTDYVDWAENGDNTSYSSYFITGYKIKGNAQRKFQNNYVYLFSDGDEPTKFYAQGQWNFANHGDTGKWGSKQLINNDAVHYDALYKRIKFRGHGLALQYKIESFQNEPFSLVGWSVFETANAMP